MQTQLSRPFSLFLCALCCSFFSFCCFSSLILVLFIFCSGFFLLVCVDFHVSLIVAFIGYSQLLHLCPLPSQSSLPIFSLSSSFYFSLFFSCSCLSASSVSLLLSSLWVCFFLSRERTIPMSVHTDCFIILLDAVSRNLIFIRRDLSSRVLLFQSVSRHHVHQSAIFPQYSKQQRKQSENISEHVSAVRETGEKEDEVKTTYTNCRCNYKHEWWN